MLFRSFLENLIAASLASVPELAKKTQSAKEDSTSRLASSTCARARTVSQLRCGEDEPGKQSVEHIVDIVV